VSDYLWFWAAKYLVELILCIGAMVPILLMAASQARRQSRCRHDTGVNETQACDAICRKCGKNLGFIGAWRARTATEGSKNG